MRVTLYLLLTILAGATLYGGEAADPEEALRQAGAEVRHGAVLLRGLEAGKLAALIPHLKALPDLRILSLAGSQARDADIQELAALPQLTSVDLSGTTVSDAGLAALKGLGPLESVRLNDTKIGALDSLKVHAAALRELQLDGTALNDAALESLGLFTKLTALSLRKTAATSAGLAALKDLVALQSLDLSDTGVDGAVLAHLAKLPELKSLKLSNTKIDDASLAALREAPKLTWLFLDGTSVSDSAVESLAALKLEVLNLRRTKLTEAGLAKLAGTLPKIIILK